jgi:hypothetical protein
MEYRPHSLPLSRRTLLQSSGAGFGYLAFAGLCGERAARAELAASGARPGVAQLVYPQRAKRVIFLFMHGGPSQVDLFDYKPRLQAEDGGQLPFKPAPNISAAPKLMKSPWKFARHGQSGQWVSELLPHLSTCIDDMCVIKSMHSRGQSHGQAVCMMHTGSDNFVRPSVGAWVSYGLGTENQRLPAFVSISPPSGHGGPRNYGTAFLPAAHQATTIGRSGKLGNAQFANLNPTGATESQRRQLDFLQSLNRSHLSQSGGDDQIEGAIESFELAFRMQEVAPEVLDFSREPEYLQKQYGIGNGPTDNFGKQCLLARRFAEAGVRYIQVSTGNVWDQHGGLKEGHARNCLAVDQPIAALLKDLKTRGMLEDTLVAWGGEFGRTPIAQGSNGRDHNPQGFCMWLAGGGIRGGISHGATDDYGYFAQQDRVHVHDLHATILHQLGVNHEQLTYRYAGRDFRLTDVYGNVVEQILS